MTLDLTIADASSARWPSDPQCPDVYYTAGYGRAAAVAESGVAYIAYWRDRIALPYVLRRIEAGGLDAVSPYGYSGLHVAAGCPPAELARFWSRLLDHWRDRGVVTLFMRFSPLDPACVEAALGLPAIEMTRRGNTFTISVGQGAKRVWDGMERRSRTAIRKAWKNGLTGGIRPAGMEDVAAGSAFRRLYGQTMTRVGSAPDYNFSDEYYHRLVDGLGKALSIAAVHDSEGVVVASGLVLTHRDRVHYHLTGSDPRAARDGANNLLLWTILEWAADAGLSTVHIGGGLGADSSDRLFLFKRGFGGQQTAFWTGTVVVDPVRYDALVAAHAAATGRSVAEIHRSSYFPGYRIR